MIDFTRNLLIITGPTACGKTSLALELADRFGLEIISADSRQVYRWMNIGTAKPSARELQRVRHHLIDIIEPHEQYSAGRFYHDARSIMDRFWHAGQPLPLIVGGTGLYLRALLEGLAPIPPIPSEIEETLRRDVILKGLSQLHQQLQGMDPVSALKIDPHDQQRIVRYLAVVHYTGIPMSEWFNRQQKPSYPFKIHLVILQWDRNILYHRIDERVDVMFANGLVEETRSLLRMNHSPTDPGLQSLGYQETIAYLENKLSLDECRELIRKNTRHFAKRQITWFKSMGPATVYNIDSNSSADTLIANLGV